MLPEYSLVGQKSSLPFREYVEGGEPTNVKERRCSPMSMGRSSLTSMNDGAH